MCVISRDDSAKIIDFMVEKKEDGLVNFGKIRTVGAGIGDRK